MGDVPLADRNHLTQLVAASPADAQKRMDDAMTGTKDAKIKACQAVYAARKVTATFAILRALSLLIGAFVPMAAAAYGGNV